MNKYTLEFLSEKFGEHADDADKQRVKVTKDWKKNNLGIPLPSYLSDDFSLPRALKVIVDEIMEMKKHDQEES